MREKKQTRTLRRLMSLLLAVMLIAGLFPAESILAVETETTVETEENTESPEAEETPTAEPAPSETVAPSPSAEPAESPKPGATPEEPEETDPTYEGSISGILWIDSNEDGTYDGDEEPLADYPVYLYAEGDTDNAVQTATTDVAGKYLFEEIETGRYVVGIKAEEKGTKFLLPLVGVQKDNKFYFTPDYSKVISNPIDIGVDTVISDIDAGMRTPPGIQPMAGATYTININSPVITGIPGVTYASSILTFTTAVDSTDNYIITGTGTATSNRIVVDDGVTTNITLSEVRISNSVTPFRLLGTANVNLTLSGTNILTCTGISTTIGVYQAGLHVAPTAALTIDGTGTLNATGGTWGAGIGGCYMGASAGNVANSSGKITITDGTVTAKGGSNSAGIGGGMYGKGTITIINGGTVTTTGGDNGAGIGDGAGYIFSDGTINITGGTVMANGGSNSAGIGGGSGGTGVTINITGGTVMATGGGNSAGIGDGGLATSSSGNITINGGTVTATGGTNAMDIGRGGSSSGTSIGSVVITGGSVLPTRGVSYVGSTPTNGSNGAPDPVGMLTFPGYSSGQSFLIVAGGTVSSYTYEANAHPDGNVYAWLAYPGAITKTATGVTEDSATLNGTYYLNGTTISSMYFEWGTSTSYGNTETLTTPSGAAGTYSDVSSVLSNTLASNTTYHYRLVIEVGGVKIPGNDMTFTTKPVVATLNVAPTGASTATISGTIASGSETISDVIITYATDAGFTANVVTIDGLSGVTYTNTTYSASLTGLTSGQTYYVKVEAVGPGGNSDAKTSSFLAGGYPVTEKFVDLSGNPVDSTGLPDNMVFVTGSYTATGILTSYTVGSDTYDYLGYKLDSYTAGDTLTSGTPSAVTITGNRNVYFVYGIPVNVTVSKTVTGGYADKTKAFTFTMYFTDSTGAPLASGTQLAYTGSIIAGSGATAPEGGILTLDSAGKDSVTLKHGQTITVADIAANGKVRIVETTDSNYTTSFKDNEDAGSTTGNDTSVRSINSADRTFAFTNARSGVVPGGIDTGSGALLRLALLAVIAALAITVVHHRRVRRH